MKISIIERLSENDDSIGLNFIHSDGNMSTVFFPKEETNTLYLELMKIIEYMFYKNMVQITPISTLLE